ncbi:MAG TPA: tRNA (adenosine(37)-N6)-dimethylallyltransferase MiaA [Pseudogracilibacillus sp.]|nr:tRNA (adenosine(37)-N6)-dimethylallyltransferase MiaA [Pseudogracilibacillus sp.]
MLKKVIVIVGPTAVGKSAVSLELGRSLPVEIISGDSMQVYQGMDIGTGKISKEEQKAVPHHLIDIQNPMDTFSAAAFQQQTKKLIAEIHERGNIPVIVGGSGLYIQAVLYNYHFSHQKRNEKVTEQLEKRLEQAGNIALYEELASIDPKHAETIHPNNHRRVIRALEVYYTTQQTMSAYQEKQKNLKPLYNSFIIGLEMERQKLYDKINRRVEKMLEEGLLDEIRVMLQRGYREAPAMKAIGYKELIPYLDGEVSLHDATALLKRNSRRYAKRQLTWFKNKMKEDVHWYTMEEEPANVTAAIRCAAEKFINKGTL